MKYEKEATTKNGRRTWKVTYELVRGPEPKAKRKGDQVAAVSDTPKRAEKSEAKPAPPANSQPNKPTPAQSRDKKRKGKGQRSTTRDVLGLPEAKEDTGFASGFSPNVKFKKLNPAYFR